jgi:HPt (histidine-containing phosphotransfer) domain-containing protein
MENNSKELHVTNLSYLIGLSRGDKSFVNKMITVFLEENPKEVQALEDSINGKKFEVIKASAHKLKSTLPFVGLDSIVGKEVAEIESLAAKQTGYEVIQTLFAKIKENCSAAYSELKVFLENN